MGGARLGKRTPGCAVRLRGYFDSIYINHYPRPDFDQHWVGLQELDGNRVLPDRLRKVLDAAPGGWERWRLGHARGSMAETECVAFVVDACH